MRDFLNEEGVLYRNASLIIRKKGWFWEKFGLRAKTTLGTAAFRTPIIFPCTQDIRLPNHALLPGNGSVCSTEQLVRQGTFLI